MKFNLRPYQLNSVDLLRQSIISGKKRPILGLPTGAGKTVTFSYLAEQAQKKNSIVGIVCHREELIEQAQKTMKNYGLNPLTLVFGMVQTFVRSPHKIPKMDLCIIDECHIGNFKRFIDLMAEVQPKCQIIGATATPVSASKKQPLRDTFDDVVYPVQIRELIEKGFLSYPNYKVWQIDEKLLEKDFNGEFTAESQARVFSFNDLITAINDRVNKTIIFCSSIQQSQTVYDWCKENIKENKSFLVHSKMPNNLRKSIVKEYLDTPDSIIVNCGILTAGFDDPYIETVIVYRATTSAPLWLQMCGRGSRVNETKKSFWIYDLGNNSTRLLRWDADKDWKSIFLLQGLKLKDKSAPTKSCVKCDAVIFASQMVCPYCLAEQPTKPKEELNSTEIKVIRSLQELPKELQKPYTEMNVKELLIRAQYGSPKTGKPFKIGWVLHQLKERPNFEENLTTLATLKNYKPAWINMQLENFKS